MTPAPAPPTAPAKPAPATALESSADQLLGTLRVGERVRHKPMFENPSVNLADDAAKNIMVERFPSSLKNQLWHQAPLRRVPLLWGLRVRLGQGQQTGS